MVVAIQNDCCSHPHQLSIVRIVVLSEPALMDQCLVSAIHLDASSVKTDNEVLRPEIDAHYVINASSTGSLMRRIEHHELEANSLVARLLLVGAVRCSDLNQIVVMIELFVGSQGSTCHPQFPV